MNLNYKLWVSAFMVASLGLVGCVNRQAQSQAKKTEAILSDPARPVTVAPVVLTNIQEKLEITGQIVTADDTTLGAKQPGRIVAMYVKDGDAVSAGQIIAQQDTSTLSLQVQQAEAQLSAARAQLSQALSNQSVVPERSRAAVRSAEAALRQARAQLQKLKVGARPEERAQLQSNVEAAKSNMDTAKKDLDRKRSLFEQGVISRQVLEVAENVYNAARTQYENALQSLSMVETGARREDIVSAEQAVQIAEEQLRSARASQRLDIVLSQQVDSVRATVRGAQTQVSLARQQLSEATVRSPINGRVAGRPVQVGAVVSPGTPIVRLIGQEGIYFEGQIPENQISNIQPGSMVTVQIDALKGRITQGKVIAINPLGTDVGRLFNARVQLTQPSETIRPGMFARGQAVLRTVRNVTVVPSAAIVDRDGVTTVYLANGDKAHRVVVKVGLRDGDKVQIDGVKAGDKVIVKGQEVLAEGTQIIVQPETAPGKESR